MVEESIINRAKKVKLLLLDVDGVLTDGRIIYDSRGNDSKFFDVHDGLCVYLLKKANIPTILITAKGSGSIKPRARDMQVAGVLSNVSLKSSVLDKILKKYRVSPDEVCFVGDDLVDLCLMKKVGLAVAVFNASLEVKKAAHYVTEKEGGKGAVREVCELILKSQGKWEEIVASYQS